ncbi:60S ribosomal protein L29-1 [Zea mays]|uniref:60S ribosomal protein L29 n=1 Tax=Zea mays TaxID=4577 RepID=A0A3L6DAF3_MAIZE|nr:60S ribosomal protein L29-1 [Zea mays]
MTRSHPVVAADEGFTMAKSKDHMAHNQSYKAYKNNIKKPTRGCQTSTKGVCVSFSLLLKSQLWFLTKLMMMLGAVLRIACLKATI